MRLVVEIPGDQLDDRLEPWQVEELAQDALGRAFAPGKVMCAGPTTPRKR